jgi:hypothetical protein
MRRSEGNAQGTTGRRMATPVDIKWSSGSVLAGGLERTQDLGGAPGPRLAKKQRSTT